MKLRFVAIEYWVGARPVKMGPALGHFRGNDRDTFFHWYGPGRMSLGKMKHSILKDYGDAGADDEDALDAMAVRFARDYPERSALEAKAGWLSPQGKYYPCGGHQHAGASRMLALELGEAHGYERYLELRGWIKTYGTVVAIPERPPTQRQIDVLFELSRLPDAAPEFKGAIMDFLRQID